MEVQLGSRNTSLLLSTFCGTFLCIQQLPVRGSMFHFSAYIWHLNESIHSFNVPCHPGLYTMTVSITQMIQFWNYEFLSVVLEAGEMCKEIFIVITNMGGHCVAYCSKTIAVRAHRSLRCIYGHVAYNNQYCIRQQHITEYYQICVRSSKPTFRSHSIIRWWVNAFCVIGSVHHHVLTSQLSCECVSRLFGLVEHLPKMKAVSVLFYVIFTHFHQNCDKRQIRLTICVTVIEVFNDRRY
jgi:hypothetical protein